MQHSRSDKMEHLLGLISLLKLRIFILLWTESIVGLILAGGLNVGLPSSASLTAVGFLATGGAAALNNYYDRDIDRLMKRTSRRPIPMGKVSPREAIWLGALMASGGVVLAYRLLSLASGTMVLAGLLTYSFVYTRLLKRTTPWNVVVGGASGSFAFLAGWTVARPVGIEAALIALMIFLWTPSHFWALAIKAVDQYRSAGLPMLPAVVGIKKASLAIMVNSALLVTSSLILFVLGFFGFVYLVVATALGGMLMASNVQLYRSRSSSAAWRAYKYSAPYLFAISVAMVMDKFCYAVVAAS